MSLDQDSTAVASVSIVNQDPISNVLATPLEFGSHLNY